MAKFAYSMQSVLNLKQNLEEQAKIAYANELAVLRREEETLERYKQKKLFYEEKMRGNMEETLDVQALFECNQGIELMKEAIKEQQKVIARAAERVEIAREKLNVAIQERKIHEKLKENAFEEFVHELNVEEGKEIDELVAYTYASAT